MDLYNNGIGQHRRQQLVRFRGGTGRFGRVGGPQRQLVVLDQQGDLVPRNQVRPDQRGYEPDDAPGSDPATIRVEDSS
jgi:hypothetical protein